MTKNIYTFEELTEQNKERCGICGEDKTASYWLRTRRIRDNRLMSMDYTCENCKGKFDRDELRKCDECERVYRWIDKVCKCEYLKSIGDNDENTDEEKEPTQNAQLEKQINELSTEKEQLKEDVEIAISALGIAEQWDSRQELIEKNEELSKKSRRLSNENQKLKEKLLGIEKELENYKTENSNLKNEVHNLKTEILTLETKIEQLEKVEAKIEQPPKK